MIPLPANVPSPSEIPLPGDNNSLPANNLTGSTSAPPEPETPREDPRGARAAYGCWETVRVEEP